MASCLESLLSERLTSKQANVWAQLWLFLVGVLGLDIFKIGSQGLFAWAGFKPQPF
jgi:hypothetical protein